MRQDLEKPFVLYFVFVFLVLRDRDDDEALSGAMCAFENSVLCVLVCGSLTRGSLKGVRAGARALLECAARRRVRVVEGLSPHGPFGGDLARVRVLSLFIERASGLCRFFVSRSRRVSCSCLSKNDRGSCVGYGGVALWWLRGRGREWGKKGASLRSSERVCGVRCVGVGVHEGEREREKKEERFVRALRGFARSS